MLNRAIGFYEGMPLDNSNVFQTKDLDMPSIGANDLLIKVEAVSVNPIDAKCRQTTTKSGHFVIQGYDACGIIEKVGDQVTEFQVGDPVMYSGTTQRDGANQKYQAVDARLVAKVSLENLAEWAALPLTSITAWELLFEKFGLIPKEKANQGKLLIINASGGVGSIAAQLAHWSGLEVYGTASPTNHEWLDKNGVAHPLDYHYPLQDQVETTFDYIAVFYDISDYIDQFAQLIRPFGKIGMIVNTRGPLDLNPFKNIGVDFYWEYMFAKTDYQVDLASQGAILKKIVDLVNEQKIHSTITTCFETGLTIENLIEATALVEKGSPGKVVISGGFHE
ncbi:zinc-binding alcohol dehydrogenase family protein [Enterococcus gallinarum]